MCVSYRFVRNIDGVREKEEEKSGVNEQQRKGKREIQRENQETKGLEVGVELLSYCGSFGLWAVGVHFSPRLLLTFKHFILTFLRSPF